jgi:predicted nucleic acid-binding protein
MVQGIFGEADTRILISRLAVIEVWSAFAGKLSIGAITEREARLSLDRFKSDLVAGVMGVVALGESHYRQAEQLIERNWVRQRLRTLDSLQLAVALNLYGQGLIEKFVTADKKLGEVAEIGGKSSPSFILTSPYQPDRARPTALGVSTRSQQRSRSGSRRNPCNSRHGAGHERPRVPRPLHGDTRTSSRLHRIVDHSPHARCNSPLLRTWRPETLSGASARVNRRGRERTWQHEPGSFPTAPRWVRFIRA